MHIGIITGEFPPMEGGVGDYTLELSTALVRLGHHIDILTTSNAGSGIPNSDPLKVHHSVKKWSMPGSYPIIQRWLRESSPDVINIQYQAAAYQLKGAINVLPKWLSLFNRQPVIVTYHDLLPPYLFPKAGPLRNWSVRYLAQHARGLIFTNEQDKSNMVRSLGHACPPLKVIPIGSNIAAQPPHGFDAASWRAEHKLSENDLVIGFFGFMNRSKGVDILVSAIARLYQDGLPVKLMFIGGRTGKSDDTNSDYADYIDAMIEEKGIANIVLKTGFVSPEAVSAALLAIDLCVLPFLEGASFRHGTLHAALTHGCAIITTKPVQANPKLEDGSVLLIQPNDTTALVDAVKTLWENQITRSSLQEKALALSRIFGWGMIAKETASFFSQVLG